VGRSLGCLAGGKVLCKEEDSEDSVPKLTYAKISHVGHLIAETNLDYVFEIDKHGATVCCSPATEHVLGYCLEVTEGTQFTSVISQSDISKAQASFERVMKGE
jgi:hypothetical protein